MESEDNLVHCYEKPEGEANLEWLLVNYYVESYQNYGMDADAEQQNS